jgi:hypothetical protein
MSTDTSSSQRRERALRIARRRLRLLEIETHRIKAELARLEAEFEDDVADRLSHALRKRRQNGSQAAQESAGPLADRFRPTLALNSSGGSHWTPAQCNSVCDDSKRQSPSLPVSIAADLGDTGPWVRRGARAAQNRRLSQPMLWSIGIHALALALCLRWTYATLAEQSVSLFASQADWNDDASAELDEIQIEPVMLDDPRMEKVAFEESNTNIADDLIKDLLPVEPAVAHASLAIPAFPTGDYGELASIDAEPGRDEAFGGQPGAADGPLGSTTFFGAKSAGDRFVFVIDNSSSMKDGRLEAAILEMLRCVEAMTRRQSFYVIFVGDQPYPMFYPEASPDLLPASAENKKRLAEWLGKVRLAEGKNRELIKAVDLAAALRPHAVFLLWDGDLRYSEAVRRDVMNHLTRPQPWQFAIHTLGMGKLSMESEQNLAAIAAARGGVYRRVEVPGPSLR